MATSSAVFAQTVATTLARPTSATIASADLSAVNPASAQVSTALEEVARANRIPSILLKGLAWQESGWQQFDRTGKPLEKEGHIGLLGVRAGEHKPSEVDRLRNDWRYNIEQGAKDLVLSWNRAPIIGDGYLDSGRNILECWYYALGRYQMGKQGKAANDFADAVLTTLSTGGEGKWQSVTVSHLDPIKMAQSLNYIGTPTPWHFGNVAPRPPVVPVVSLTVPYVHQVYDSPDNFEAGGGSCGPSSMLMILGFYKKIEPHTLSVHNGSMHDTPFGFYLPDVHAKVCEPNLGAVHAKMLDYFRPSFPDVAIYYDEKATYARVKAELDAGRPCILGTRVTPAGHIMVARGYLTDGRLLINDPAGDREQASRRDTGAFSPTGVRYWNHDGDKAIYDWEALEVRWVMTFGPRSSDADHAEDENLLDKKSDTKNVNPKKEDKKVGG